jgi:hypothetical protein
MWGVVEESWGVIVLFVLSIVIWPGMKFRSGRGGFFKLSMRYHSSTALEDGAPSGLVAGARMAMNGAPWWTTLGNDGGRNNVVLQKNLGLGRVSGVFHKKSNNHLLSKKLCCVHGIT